MKRKISKEVIIKLKNVELIVPTNIYIYSKHNYEFSKPLLKNKYSTLEKRFLRLENTQDIVNFILTMSDEDYKRPVGSLRFLKGLKHLSRANTISDIKTELYRDWKAGKVPYAVYEKGFVVQKDDAGRRRSLSDIVGMIGTYFPEYLTEEGVHKILKACKSFCDESRAYWHYCTSPNKVVLNLNASDESTLRKAGLVSNNHVSTWSTGRKSAYKKLKDLGYDRPKAVIRYDRPMTFAGKDNLSKRALEQLLSTI